MLKRCAILFIALNALFCDYVFAKTVASSANYSLSAYETDMGSFSMSSENYSTENTIGANFIGIVLSDLKKIASGFIAVISGEEEAQETVAYDIDYVKAYTSPMGRVISAHVWQNDNTPYFTWGIRSQTVEVQGYSYSLNQMPDDEVDTSATAVDFSSEPLQDGKNIFYVKACSSGVSCGEVGEFHIWVDTQCPKISSLNPASGSLLTEKKFDVSFSLSDNTSGINKNTVSVKINGRTCAVADSEGGKFICGISSISDGPVTVTVSAEDLAGNKMPIEMWSFAVDTTAPKGSVIINNGAAYTNVIYALLHMEASDNYSGVEYMRIGNTITQCKAGEWMNFSEDIQWNLPPYSGQHTVYVQFKDLAGNISSVYQDSIMLDIIAPDTVITSGPSGVSQYNEAFFKFSASKEDCWFSYRLDNGDWSQWSKDNSAFLVNLARGKHIFSVRAAKDINNNMAIDVEEIDPSPAQRIWFVGEIENKNAKVKPRLWRLE